MNDRAGLALVLVCMVLFGVAFWAFVTVWTPILLHAFAQVAR